MAEVRDILNRLKAKPLHRTMKIERGAASKDTRTVKLAFASDKPVDHWFGRLALTMNRKAMRSARLDAGAPLLVDHDPKEIVGVIENYSIGGDGLARATVRFGNSVRAEEVFRDVLDGIRSNVSVGFMVHEMTFEGRDADGVEVYRSDDWEPYEVSLVSVPADISVGVGRNISISTERQTNMSDITTTNQPPHSPDLAAAEEIRQWGETLNEQRVTSAYIRANTLDDGRFTGTKAGLFQAIRAAQPITPRPVPMDPVFQAMREGGFQPYELARSIPRYGKLKAFSGPGAEERAYRFGQWILGAPLGNSASRNWAQQNGLMVRAAQVEGIDAKGGYLVPEEFGNDFVQLLEKYGVFRRNAHIVPMSSDRRTDYVLNGELQSEFIAEMQEGTDQDLDFGMISYTAQKHMILVPFSSEVSEDSAISIGDQLAEAAGRAFAKKEDLCGFLGNGTSTYGGMTGLVTALKAVDADPANVKGLQIASGNTFSEIVLTDFSNTVKRLPSYARANAKWYMTDDFYWGTVVPLLLDAGGVTIAEIEASRGERLFGKPVEFTEVMPSTDANGQVVALLGDLGLGARLADRRMFTYKVDESILIRKDGLLFQATARFDVNCSFGVGDTTAAGPVVGLITAAS